MKDYAEVFEVACKRTEFPRQYIGASVIGDDCTRRIWYGFRWWKTQIIPGRIARIFDTGHSYELRIFNMLASNGCEAVESQKAVVDPKTPWLKGRCDGIVDGLLFECKTANEAGFKKFKGNLKADHPKYYGQVQTYMGFLKLKQCLFVVVNKNTDDLHIEIVDFDFMAFRACRNRAKSVVLAEVPPARLSDNPADYRCKMCFSYGYCHGDEQPDKNCRTCRHSLFRDDAMEVWCGKHERLLDYDMQLEGCNEFEAISE